MILRKDLETYLAQFLAVGNFEDYAPNGLQVEGIESIQKIATAVTASQETIEEAIRLKADALLVHHGFFWKGESPLLTGMKKNRIASLLQANLNVFAYHLPLDCHAELGNNACLGALFPLKQIQMHAVGRVPQLLWSGEFEKPLSIQEITVLLSKKLQREPLHIAANSNTIKTIAWCSGGAEDYIVMAKDLGMDAYLSGEVSERTYYQAKELDIHYFAGGHHATERLGIQRLGQHLAERYSLEHHFIDSDNPV